MAHGTVTMTKGSCAPNPILMFQKKWTGSHWALLFPKILMPKGAIKHSNSASWVLFPGEGCEGSLIKVSQVKQRVPEL